MLGTWIVVLKAFNISISCRTSLRLVVPMIRSLRPCPHNRASVKKGETREEASWECFSSPQMGNRKWMCKNTKKIVRLHLSASEFASINHTHLGSRSWSPAAGLIELRTNEKHQLPTKINLCWTILQMPLEHRLNSAMQIQTPDWCWLMERSVGLISCDLCAPFPIQHTQSPWARRSPGWPSTLLTVLPRSSTSAYRQRMWSEFSRDTETLIWLWATEVWQPMLWSAPAFALELPPKDTSCFW